MRTHIFAAALFALIVPVSGQAQLLHHYSFATNANDGVGVAHGVLVGGATAGGGVLSLNGSTAFVQFGSHIVPTSGSYTVALFAKRNSAQAGLFTEFISQGSSGGPGFYIGTNTSGNLRLSDSWLNPGVAAFGVGIMGHYALVVNAGSNTSSLYMNGLFVTSAAFAISTTAGGTDTRLGRQFNPFAEYFNGELADVRIYGNALSAAEVNRIANPATVPEPTTVALFGLGLAAVGLARRRRR